MLSVPLLVFFALARGAMSSVWESDGVTAGLQMVKQLVSCGELVVTDHAAEVYFFLEVKRGISDLNRQVWIFFLQ